MRAASCHLILALGVAALSTGCVHRTPALYQWGGFPKMQYQTLLRSGDAPAAQVGAMETQAARALGKGAALPPGFRAHLGMLKLSAGNAGAARELWQAEKEAFPESAPYMDQLIKRLDTPATQPGTPPKDSPT